MKIIEITKAERLINKLSARIEELPFQVQQAWMFSSYNMAHYLREHANNGAGLNSKNSTLMAAGRLDWLLQEARLTLTKKFSEADIYALLDCYQGDIFSPDRMHAIASGLCNHLGIGLDEYKISSLAPLIDKLCSLDTVQRLALVDALEQTWHRGMRREKMEPRDFLESIGILLK